MIDWEKVRDAIIIKHCYDKDDISLHYKDMIHIQGSVGSIIDTVKQEIENQIQKILKSIK